MFFKDLFNNSNVNCPSWLEKDFLEDDWLNSNYELDNGVHTWTLKNDLKNAKITFDGVECHFQAFNDDGKLMLDNFYTEELDRVC